MADRGWARSACLQPNKAPKSSPRDVETKIGTGRYAGRGTAWTHRAKSGTMPRPAFFPPANEPHCSMSAEPCRLLDTASSTPTPATHARVLSRPRASRVDGLVNAFGWNRPFRLEDLEGPYAELLSQGALLQPVDDGVKSLVRFSTLGGMLFAHSSYPTTQPDAVFFGPDTYRYARAIRWLADHSPEFQPQTIIDIGAGSGAGGIFAASIFPGRPAHRFV